MALILVGVITIFYTFGLLFFAIWDVKKNWNLPSSQKQKNGAKYFWAGLGLFLLLKYGEPYAVRIDYVNEIKSTAGTNAMTAPLDDAKAAYNHKDYQTAIRLLTPLAEQGNAEAQSWLGVAYFFGEGLPKDAVEAVKWFRKAAEQGNADAQYGLGRAYSEGEGVQKDAAESMNWFRKAAENGQSSAQSWLGIQYLVGTDSVPKDDVEAVKWLRKAAEQGNAEGQYGLGLAYIHGLSVPQDAVEAVKWFRKAAEQGNIESGDLYYRLGMAYFEGTGVPKDYVQSYMWFNLAATQVNQNATSAEAIEKRSLLEKLMTPEQIAEAQRLSRERKPSISAEEK